MPVEIIVPRLGWSMDEGTFTQWLKSDGEQVNAGEMIFILEGEKASQEIESFDSGILHIPTNAPKAGDTVAVGQLLGYLLAAGESLPSQACTSVVSPESQRQVRAESTVVAGPAARRRARELGVDLKSLQTIDPTGRVRPDDLRQNPTKSTVLPVRRADSRVAITPRARAKARALGVDWSKVSGTGRNHRIRERDILAFAEQPQQVTPTGALLVVPGSQRTSSKIRRTIAQRMMAGVHQTAPVTLTTKVDATELLALRERFKADEICGTAPSYSDIIAKLVTVALPECPEMNACWHNNGVFLYDAINIAMAVDAPSGLVAPVINDVASHSLEDIATQSRTLSEQAHDGTLSENQLQGGTFTITNLGMFDIDFFTPIINLPQSAILGIGRIVREPVVVGDQVVPGYRLGLSLTFDHRVVDGAPAARWLQRLSQMIEHPQQFVSHANV